MLYFNAPLCRTLVIALLTVPALNASMGVEPDSLDLFTSGQGGYDTYRIPSVITTTQGTVLAFCEGRKNSAGDSGDIDLLMKRSEDGGLQWSDTAVVWDDGDHTCGNPCPIVDRVTGDVHLLLTWNRGSDGGRTLHDGSSEGTRRVFYCRSGDDGRSWSEPVEITDQAKDPSWWWYATGPGVGIQINRGNHRGRLVVPCDHTAPGYYYGAHVIYSDDHGRHWQRSTAIQPTCNESQVVELADGRLMINMRSQEKREAGRPRNGYRSISFSDDGGATWSPPTFDSDLGDPVCQASLIRYDGERLLFSHPNPPISPGRGKRIRMTVRLSRDDGESWSDGRLIHEGGSAYSCLTRLPDGDVGLLYEKTTKDSKRVLCFSRFPIESIP